MMAIMLPLAIAVALSSLYHAEARGVTSRLQVQVSFVVTVYDHGWLEGENHLFARIFCPGAFEVQCEVVNISSVVRTCLSTAIHISSHPKENSSFITHHKGVFSDTISSPCFTSAFRIGFDRFRSHCENLMAMTIERPYLVFPPMADPFCRMFTMPILLCATRMSTTLDKDIRSEKKMKRVKWRPGSIPLSLW